MVGTPVCTYPLQQSVEPRSEQGLKLLTVFSNRYRGLKKPSWQPPAFLFGESLVPLLAPVRTSRRWPLNSHAHAGPVWTTIYALMGLASWMVWTHGGFEQQKVRQHRV
jgi:tryptophan-rich sensory protein